MIKRSSDKSLKDQNRWPLWLTLAVNALVFYLVSQADVINSSGWAGLLTKATNLLPVGMACIVTTIANGIISANGKARIVFLRWRHALPGHRAFSEIAKTDPRIDQVRLKKALGNKMPASPEAENTAWYRFYKEVENEPAVQHVHREFLFTRDYTAFAALILITFGPVALFVVQPWHIAALYVLALVVQLVVVRHAAATYGTRFVCTVLASKVAKATSASR